MKEKYQLFLILTIINFGLITNSYAQFFNINLGRFNPYIETTNSEALQYKDSLWLINSHITRYLTGNYIYYPSITTINNKGEILDEIFPTDTFTFHYYADWLKGSNDEIIIVGTEYDSSNNAYFFLLKLNKDLNVIFKNSIKCPRNIGEISKLKLLPNGNLAFCGLIQNYDYLNKEYEEMQGIFYLLDSFGNELWHLEYGDSINTEKIFDFTWDVNYNFYLAGQWVEPYIDTDFQSLLIKANSKGKIEYSKLYGVKEELEAFSNIELFNNKLICIGAYNTSDPSQNWGGFRVVLFDTTGQYINNFDYYEYDTEPYACLREDSIIVCAGQKFDEQFKGSGFLLKFTIDGDTIWKRDYPLFIQEKKYTQRLKGINKSKNGYILTGITSKKFLTNFAPNSQVWVMTVDSLGYDHITQFPTATYEPEENIENNIITFFPNPTSGELFFRWKDLVPLVKDRWVVSFYDLQGKLVYSHPMTINENSLMLESLSPGVYPYVIRDSKNVYVSKGKILVQSKY